MLTKNHLEFVMRSRAERRGEPACRAKGPWHAICVLEPHEDAEHEGNGFDEFGPKYVRWTDGG